MSLPLSAIEHARFKTGDYSPLGTNGNNYNMYNSVINPSRLASYSNPYTINSYYNMNPFIGGSYTLGRSESAALQTYYSTQPSYYGDTAGRLMNSAIARSS